MRGDDLQHEVLIFPQTAIQVNDARCVRLIGSPDDLLALEDGETRRPVVRDDEEEAGHGKGMCVCLFVSWT